MAGLDVVGGEGGGEGESNMNSFDLYLGFFASAFGFDLALFDSPFGFPDFTDLNELVKAAPLPQQSVGPL